MVVVSVFCEAQTFTNVPNDSIVGSALMDEVTVFDIVQNNIQPDTIILSWAKVSASIPDQWEVLICDNQVCYPDLHLGSTMLPVYTGQNGLMSLHITPHTNSGIAIVRYAIWDNDYPMVTDTLTWIISSFQTGINAIQQNGFTVFISGNNLVIKKNNSIVNHFQIFDERGKILKQFSLDENVINFNVSNFPEGIYFVRAGSSERTFVQKILIPAN